MRVSTDQLPFLTISGIGVQLQVEEAQITLDENWVPYCEAILTCAMPDAVTAQAIDPMASEQRVSFTLSQVFEPWSPSRPSVTRPFDLVLRYRTIDHATDQLILHAYSDEALLLDGGRLATTTSAPGYTSARDMVALALTSIGARLAVSNADAVITPEVSVWQPGVTGWDYLEPVLQAGSLRLWCDERRRWKLDVAGSLDQSNAVQLSTGQNIKQAQDTKDREAGLWYDAVVVSYSWLDTNNVQQQRYDAAGASTPKRIRRIDYARPYPGPGAAASVLSRAKNRGREVPITAVSDFTASATQPALVTLPSDTPELSAVVSSVVFTLPADEMRVTLRDVLDTPANSWLSDPAGATWLDVAAGVPWTV